MTFSAVYFAYGSNLDPEQMRERCPFHVVRGPAWLPNYRLCFPRRSPLRRCGTAGIETCVGNRVWGALYELTEEDVRRLHSCEGYRPDRPPQESRHTVMDVEVVQARSHDRRTAYTYIAVPDKSCALPSRDYMSHIIRGAEYHGLPPDYIAALRAVATEHAP